MLTATATPANETYTTGRDLSQIETLPPDHEILDRVMEIRSQWSVEERIERRKEADRRFVDLIDLLTSADVAA